MLLPVAVDSGLEHRGSVGQGSPELGEASGAFVPRKRYDWVRRGSFGGIFDEPVRPALALVVGSVRIIGAHKNPLPIVRRVFRGSPRPVRLPPGRPWHQELSTNPRSGLAASSGVRSLYSVAGPPSRISHFKRRKCAGTSGCTGQQLPPAGPSSNLHGSRRVQDSRWTCSITCFVVHPVAVSVVLAHSDLGLARGLNRCAARTSRLQGRARMIGRCRRR